MLNRDVEQVYALVSVGTPVIIKGYEPFASIRRPLAPRTIGQDVVELQRQLQLAGVYGGPWSGVYTGDVERAVQKFQTLVGLNPSGIATLETVKKLGEYTHQNMLKPRYLTARSS
jgi:peptidoglycan hydrolase-like protein with peptidoglycan-binding domain